MMAYTVSHYNKLFQDGSLIWKLSFIDILIVKVLFSQKVLKYILSCLFIFSLFEHYTAELFNVSNVQIEFMNVKYYFQNLNLFILSCLLFL